MTSRLLKEAELFFTDTLRRLNLVSSKGSSYSNLKDSDEDVYRRSSGVLKNTSNVRSLLFIVLWIEISFLHSCLPLGGLAFVWQQHERNVAVYTIFTLRLQTSAKTRKQCKTHSSTLCLCWHALSLAHRPAGMDDDDELSLLWCIWQRQLHLSISTAEGSTGQSPCIDHVHHFGF